MPGGPRLGFRVVTTPDLQVVAQAFFTTAKRAADMVEPMQEALLDFSSEIGLNFAMEGRPTHWEPLSEATIAMKTGASLGREGRADINLGTAEYKAQKIGEIVSSIKILQASGELEQTSSIPEAWRVEHHGQQVIASFMDTTGYGHFHVEGNAKLPVRDYTYISDEAIDQAKQYFVDWILEGKAK